MTAALRVLLADDHAVLRSGLGRLLEAVGMVVVAEACNGEQAYQLHKEHAPDVTVMDLAMPGFGGLEALRRIVSRDAGARVVIFSMHESPAFASQALHTGARGYVVKSAPPEELIAAIQAAAAGGIHITPAVAQSLAMQAVNGAEDPVAHLSSREFEIFRLLAEGEDLEVIAQRLNISPKTVANHQSLLKQKLGISKATELVRLALRHGLIDG